jgi:hypothetical protein
MPKFRKKPVVIDAWQFPGFASMEAVRTMPSWLAGKAQDRAMSTSLFIATLEGTMEASPGDWIIRGVKGEVYPCKPDIFTATYDPVEP